MSSQITSNIDVVVCALATAGGANRKISTEQIAYNCFKLAPDRFSWVLPEYKDFPDKYVVKTTLEDAAKKKYGALVQGRYARDHSKDGWLLTPAGVKWFESNSRRIATALEIAHRISPALPPTEVKRFQARMARERAYQTFLSTGSLDGVSRFMFADMLQASPDAPIELMKSKFDLLLSLAQLANDPLILGFLKACEQRFVDLVQIRPEGSNG